MRERPDADEAATEELPDIYLYQIHLQRVPQSIPPLLQLREERQDQLKLEEADEKDLQRKPLSLHKVLQYPPNGWDPDTLWS